MNATFGCHRSGWTALAVCCAWGILILAGQPLAVPAAHAQSSTSTTTLQGGVQQNATTGDVFNGGDSGPTNTNQPGVGGSPACHQIDPECGGTDRQCYNEAYHSTAIVMSVAKRQNLYQQTRGQIWIRCGACRSNVICWPRPGYEDLIAGRGNSSGASSAQGSGGTQGGSGPSATGASPMDDTMRNVVASCGRILQQNGSLDSRPGCRAGSVLEWCRQFQQNNPTCVAIVADSGGGLPHYTVNGTPATVNNGQVMIPGGAKDAGSVQGTDRSPIAIGGVQQPGYWNPARPYYNGTYRGPLGEDSYTIDVAHEDGNVQNPRTVKDRSGAVRTGIVIPNFDPSGFMDYMWLVITQEKVELNGSIALDQNGNVVDQRGNVVLNATKMLSKLQVWPSNQRTVPAPSPGKYVGY
jgi:hypothetical protein